MKQDEELMIAAYEPFRRETWHCLRCDLLPIFFIVALVIYNPERHPAAKWMIGAIIVGLLAEISIRYSITILSRVEINGRLFETKPVVLEKIIEQGSSGEYNRKYSSIIYRVYPKEACYGRYIILCRTEDGKRIKLRCAVSGKNRQLITTQIWNGPGWKRTVTYGRLSRVILWYNDKDDLSYVLNHRLDHIPQTRENKEVRRRGK